MVAHGAQQATFGGFAGIAKGKYRVHIEKRYWSHMPNDEELLPESALDPSEIVRRSSILHLHFLSDRMISDSIFESVTTGSPRSHCIEIFFFSLMQVIFLRRVFFPKPYAPYIQRIGNASTVPKRRT